MVRQWRFKRCQFITSPSIAPYVPIVFDVQLESTDVFKYDAALALWQYIRIKIHTTGDDKCICERTSLIAGGVK